jgi:hypothetical protein
MMAELEKQKTENVAIVVVPSRAAVRMPSTTFPTFVLTSHNDWFAATPYVIKLDKGVCMAVGKQIMK